MISRRNEAWHFSTLFLVTVCFILLASITGCSEGSSNNRVNDSHESESGIGLTDFFIDATVSGLEYKINGEQYLTNENDSWEFEPNRKVSFYIGDICLGSAAGRDILTPIEHVSDTLGETDSLVLSRLCLLKTLYNDTNLNNRTQIFENTLWEEKEKPLISIRSTYDFATNTSTLISELTSTTSEGSRILVSKASAPIHFHASLLSFYQDTYRNDFLKCILTLNSI